MCPLFIFVLTPRQEKDACVPSWADGGLCQTLFCFFSRPHWMWHSQLTASRGGPALLSTGIWTHLSDAPVFEGREMRGFTRGRRLLVQASRSRRPALPALGHKHTSDIVLFILEGKGRAGQRRWVRLHQTVFHTLRFPAELRVLADSRKRAVIVLLARWTARCCWYIEHANCWTPFTDWILMFPAAGNILIGGALH